jgi:hypothetical protein
VIGGSSAWFAYSKIESAKRLSRPVHAMYLLADDHPWLPSLLGGYAVAVWMDGHDSLALKGLIASSYRKKS